MDEWVSGKLKTSPQGTSEPMVLALGEGFLYGFVLVGSIMIVLFFFVLLFIVA
jgi:hypothetical protein